jgi:hypothetical protein
MSGVGQAVFMNQRSFVPPLPAIGAAYEGGFFAGQISTTADGVATHNLVVGPLSTAQNELQWKTSNSFTAGTVSDIDGPANTAAQITAGAAAHPCANFCNNLSLGGFSDWYMPAKNELEVCYFNLKPTTDNNNTGFGINPNAVPSRGSNYTSGSPAQTAAASFQDGGAEAFVVTTYWASTEVLAATAVRLSFDTGQQESHNKNNGLRVRAIRRVAV